MTRDEFDSLLKELTDENLTTERQLEIFSNLQDDKQKHIDNETSYVENTDKLINEVKQLKSKTIDDFFKYGRQGEPPKQNNTPTEPTPPEPTPVKSYNEIVADMIGE